MPFLITDDSVGAAPSGEIGSKSGTVLLEMLTDDVDDETTDIEFVTTPRTDSEEAEPQEAEISKQEEEVEKPDAPTAPTQNKEAALDETTKDLLNESFEAMINIHR